MSGLAAAPTRTAQQFLPFALPDITEEEIESVVAVLRSGWLTTGPKTKQFEQEFADYIGAAHAVALNSGTAALHLALEAIGLGPGDEVIVPAYTFTATAEVVRYFGARPVLVDVRSDDLTINVAAVAEAITSRTRAIIAVDLAGHPADWPQLRSIADEHGLFLIDDAAHALPSRLEGKLIGRWADLTAFSFYATKTLTTGEGGMLVTERADWANRARTMSLHGIGKDAWKRYTAEGSWYYEVLAPGFKYNMTDIAAALGVVQLRRVEAMAARRAEIAAAYTAALSSLSAVELPTVRLHRTSSWHLYILRLRLDHLRCDRGQFIQALSERGIGTGVHFIPLHLHPYYRDTYHFSAEAFPVAYREYLRALSLPIYSRMDDEDVARVIEAVKQVAEAYHL